MQMYADRAPVNGQEPSGLVRRPVPVRDARCFKGSTLEKAVPYLSAQGELFRHAPGTLMQM